MINGLAARRAWVRSGWQSVAAMVVAVCVLTISARVSLPVGVVPVTAQTLAVLVIGALLGRQAGTGAVLAYLAAGAAGLPVFAMGGGAMYLLGPTGGFLLGFLPAAWLAGALAERGWTSTARRCLPAMLLADAVIFACGLAWLALWNGGFTAAMASGLLVFVPGEVVKIAAAAVVAMRRR